MFRLKFVYKNSHEAYMSALNARMYVDKKGLSGSKLSSPSPKYASHFQCRTYAFSLFFVEDIYVNKYSTPSRV